MTRITDLTEKTTLTGAEFAEISSLSTSVTITATTISALASDNSYNDSGSGFVAAGFAIGDRVNVTGFTGDVANNIFAATVTAVTAGKLTIGGTDGDVIVDDAAGESVTITKWESKRAAAGAVGAVGTFSGALASRDTSAQTIPITTFTAIAFNAESYDSGGWHDNSTNPSRMTVPAGISKAQFTFNVALGTNATRLLIQLYKNGSSTSYMPRIDTNESPSGGQPFLNLASAWLDVSPGDYFEVFVYSNVANTVLSSGWAWFGAEGR